MSKSMKASQAVVSAGMSKVSSTSSQFKTFKYRETHPRPIPKDGIMMDNLRFICGDQPVKYSVEFTEERTYTPPSGPSSVFLHFNVTCIDSNGHVVSFSDRGPPEVKVPTNFEYVSKEERAIRLILDILKDAAAGGVTKADMKKILTSLGFNVGIIDGKTIDSLIDKLKIYVGAYIKPYPKPAYHERSVDGLYKMALFMARLLFLETGSLSKFSSFTVYEKGIWRACNAFVQSGGAWNGLDSLLGIIAAGFALHFQTHATIMDPASPCQSSLVSSMRRVMTSKWFDSMYGLDLANRTLTIDLLQDWCSEADIANLQLSENSEGGGHFVPTDATEVTLNILCKTPSNILINQAFSGFVYSTVPEVCAEKWSQTPRQRFSGFERILLGNTENSKVFSSKDLGLILGCMIGKEDGDCDQMYAILYYAIQLATHRYYNNTESLSWEACFTEVMKEIMVVTCDRVVYYTCMCLKISCTYTGSGDGVVYVYEPYKHTLKPAELLARNLELSKKKLESECENSMKFLSSQNKMLSAVMFCGISSVRYKNPDTPDVQYEPFPNNCYTGIKELVSIKKDTLVVVSECVSFIKQAIHNGNIRKDMLSILARFVLAIVITNLAVFAHNMFNSIIVIFKTAFSNFGDLTATLDSQLKTPYVNDIIIKSPIILKHFQPPSDAAPNEKYYQDIAQHITLEVSSLMSNPDDANSIMFLELLNNYILNDVNNKCVSTAQEPSIYAGTGNLTLYILNNVIIPNVVFNAWKSRAPQARDRRSVPAAAGIGDKKGGRIHKKIIQTGGDQTAIIKEALEVNLNDKTKLYDFGEGHKSNGVNLDSIIQTQINPSVLRPYLTSLSVYREERIAELDEILKKFSHTPSASPVRDAQHRRQPAAALASAASAAETETDDELIMLLLERNEQEARLSKEKFMNEMLQNDISEQDKEYYWKTRNELIPQFSRASSLTIIEKTVLEMSDIEMLVCMYASISHFVRPATTLDGYLRTAYAQLQQQPYRPLAWLNIEIPGVINDLYTQIRQAYYPNPNPNPNAEAIGITKYLLYGETSNPENIIPDNTRIVILFMLHIFLNEVIMDMIPDSYGLSLVISPEIKKLLEKTYTLSSSIDPSNYTKEQIEEAQKMAASMSVSSGKAVNHVLDTGFGFGSVVAHSPGTGSGFGGFATHSPGGSAPHSPGYLMTPLRKEYDDDIPESGHSVWFERNVVPGVPDISSFLSHFEQNELRKRTRTDEPGGGKYGGSTARTRRKVHRNHRRTQYTNKHKRYSKSTKYVTIKHSKSYRKHNRTIKRRSHRK